MSARAVTDASFEEDVLAAPTPVLVHFCAPWCKPCEAVEPIVEQLAAERNVDVVHVDVDANPVVAARYGVLTLPTVILFANGEPRAEVLGARPRRSYERSFADWLG